MTETDHDHPLRVLFFIRHAGYLLHYESVLELLARRGCRIHICFDRIEPGAPEGKYDRQIVERLRADHPALTVGTAPERGDAWQPAIYYVRLLRDYLRYLRPSYRHAPKLAARAASRVGFRVAAALRLLVGTSERGQRGLDRVLQAIEQAVPPSRAIVHFLHARRPDLVLITPLIDFGSGQHDYLKAARAAGLRSAVCVASWDNLTNKGLIQRQPDRVLVWNNHQKQEAIDLHGIPADKVRVTGAQCFDRWFERRPSTSRADFCRKAGLDPARPYVLYLCSSKFIGGDETGFVARWLTALRARPDAAMRELGVLIRPHPFNTHPWREMDIGRFRNVTVWPPRGAYPSDEQARADYFDSIHHSTAVVGVNTSGLIEAGIVGRDALTVLAPEFADTQQGTLHFDYLVRDGYLQVSHSFDEHFQQLEKTLANPDERRRRIGAFLESFIRPHGLDRPCTPRVVEAIEELGRSPAPVPRSRPWWALVVLSGLFPLAWSTWLLAPVARALKRILGVFGVITGSVGWPGLSRTRSPGKPSMH